MEAWQKNQVLGMKFIDCEHLMFGKLVQWSADLGFEFCSFGMRTPLPVINPVAMAISNYPEALQRAYQRTNYVSIDPVIEHGLRSQEIMMWSDERFSRDPEVWQAARAAGIRSGVSQSTRGVHGVAGLLNLSTCNGALSAAELEDKKARITWLANLAHQGLSRYLVANFMPSSEIKLSDREITVLRWIAEGKTSSEISDILQIAERTVNFHLNNANDKLGTNNRTAAAVHAALLGLL